MLMIMKDICVSLRASIFLKFVTVSFLTLIALSHKIVYNVHNQLFIYLHLLPSHMGLNMPTMEILL